MELVYLWVDSYKNIKNQGFNFSPRFEFHYDKDSKKLIKIRDESTTYKSIFPDNINITAIVGENGSGKTSILERILDFFIESNNSIIIFAIDEKLYCNYNNFHDEIEIIDTSIILGRNNKYLSVITNTSDFQNNEFFLNRELSIYEDLHPMSVKEHYSELTNELLKLNYSDLYSFESAIVFNSLIKTQSLIFKPIEYKIEFTKKHLRYRLFDILLYDNFLNNIDSPDLMLISKKYIDMLFKEKETEYIIKFYLFLTKKEADDNEYYILKEFVRNNSFIENIASVDIEDDFIIIFNSVYNKDNFLSISENKNNLIKLSESKIFNKLIGKLFVAKLNETNRIYDDLSQGEKKLLLQEGLFYKNIMSSDSNNILILLDETEINFHPNWQKQNINLIIKYLSQFQNKRIHLLVAIHSPFILSDIPKENVIFLDKYKENEDENQKVGNCKNATKDIDMKTFGANIHTLLSHGFFMENGLMGEFAKKTIQDVINYLNDKPTQNMNKQKAWQIIQLVGEPFLKHKLEEKYNEKFLTKEEQKQNKIKQLENELKRLKDDNTQS
jgi:energy-coupling factor transporter ATP-binding protein EcfA2